MEHKYNYIIFNGFDGYNASAYNEDGYYSICMRDLWDDEGVLITNMPMDYANCLVKKICIVHTHKRSHLPFKKIWYPFFFKHHFKKEKPFCFISIGYKWSVDYYKWLKHRYPDAKFVRFARDLISTQQNEYDELKNSGVMDYWISYDEIEAQKYGMLYHREVESKIDMPDVQIKYDVFFAGRAKKRLPQIISAYDALEKKGLNCFFYIMGAKEEEKVVRNGIVYNDKLLTYRQMLNYNMQSKCLLEINQEGAVGYTSRFIESILYNKLLLTDNPAIKSTPFYNDNYMVVFANPSDIKTDFISNYAAVNYDYQGEFSPTHFIDFLDKILP